MTKDRTGAPADVVGGMPATEDTRPPTDAAPATDADPLNAIDANSRRRLATIADRLIPAAHGMPSAADVVDDDRLRFVLRSRPDLLEPLLAALRADLGDDAQARLDTLASDEPTVLAALQLVIVAGYYTDARVRELISYPGQLAIPVQVAEYPPYVSEGLIDAVVAQGPVWRDPRTGRRAVAMQPPRTYSEQTWSAMVRTAEGGNDGRDEA